MNTLRRYRTSLGGMMTALVAFWQIAPPKAHAVTYIWDPAGNQSNSGGTGIWNLSNQFWNDDSVAPNLAWPNATDAGAQFQGTGGTVTVSGGTGVTANQLLFMVDNYLLNSATAADVLNLAGTSPGITVQNAGQTATIQSIITGTVGLAKNGAGRLIVSGANIYTGGTSVNAGVLQASIATGANPLSTGSITLNGGTLALNPTANTSTAGISFRTGAGGGGVVSSVNYGALTGVVTGTIANMNRPVMTATGTSAGADALPGQTVFSNYGAEFRGKINLTTGGVVTFALASDDGSRLYVDGIAVLNNDVGQGVTTPVTGSITLSAGLHDIRILNGQGTGGGGVTLNWTPPGGTAEMLGTSSNTLFTAESVTAAGTSNAIVMGNDMALTASSTIDFGTNANFTEVAYGAMSRTTGTTLTVNALTNKLLRYTSTTFNGGGTHAYDGTANVAVGLVSDGGTAVTIDKLGSGRLIFDQVAVANTLSASSVIRISQGTVVGIGSTAAGTNNPFGSAQIQMNGGNLALDSYLNGATFNNVISVTSSGRLYAIPVAAQPVILGGNVSLAAGAVLTLDPSGNTTTGTGPRGALLRINGIISGSGSIVQDSSAYGTVSNIYTRGEVLLTGANTFTGGYTALNNSIIRVGVNSTGTFPTITNGAFGTGVLTLGNGSGTATNFITITSFDGTARTIANEMEFLDNLVSGSGTTFTGGMTFTGPADLNGGIRSINTNVLSTFSGVISSSTNNAGAGILKLGASTLQLDGNNTFGGGLNFSNASNGSTVRVGHDNALGTGTLTFDLNTNNVTIRFRASNATARVLNNAVAFTGANTNAPVVFGESGTGALEFNGNWDLGTTSRILQFDSAATIDGVVSNTAALAKRGFSTLTLTGANTYTGATSVQDGQMVVAGSDASIASSSSITVQNRISNSNTSLVVGATTDAVAGSLNRLSNTGTITFNTSNGGGNMGNLAMTYNGPVSVGSGGFVETVGGLVFQGGGLVTLTLNPATGQQLALTQTAGSAFTTTGTTVLVRGTNLGAAAGADTSRLILGSAPFTSLTGGVLASVIASANTTGTGTTFVTYDPVNGMRGLLDAEYSSSLVADDDISLATSASLGSNLNVNSLRITANGVNLDLGGNRLWIKSGNVLFNGTGTIGNGILDFGAQTASISLMGGAAALNPVTLAADLYGMRGLNFASDLLANRAILGGDNRRLIGPVTVANLTVTLGSSHALNDYLPQDLNIAQSGAVLQVGGNNIYTGNLNRGLVDGIGGGAVIENASAAAGTITFQQAANGTFAGVLRNGAGGGVLNLVKTGAGTLDLQGDSSLAGTAGFGGTITVKRGVLQLFRAADFDDATAINLLGGGTFRIANRSGGNNNTDRLLDAAAVTMSGGTFDFDNDAAAGTNFSEGVGALNILAGANNVRADVAATAQTSTLTFASLNGPAVSAGATLNFASDGGSIGTDARGRVVFTLAPNMPAANNLLIGGWAVVAGTDFAIYNTTGTISVRAAQAANYQAGAETTWDFDQNAAPAGDVTTTASRNINALKLGDGIDIFQGANHTLNIELGGIVKSGTNGSVIRNGFLTAGNTSAQNLYVYTTTALSLDTSIINNSGGSVGLVKSGSSTLTLTRINSYSGGTFLNEGTLAINTDGRLGAASGALYLRGGTLAIQGGVRPITLEREVNINDAGGTLDVAGISVLTINGTLTGSGDRGTLGLVKAGTGTLVLAGNNTFSAPITVNAGILSISADANLGAVPTTEIGDWLTLNGGTLANTATLTLHASRGVNVTANSNLDVLTNTTLNVGSVLTGTATLTKVSNGQLNFLQGVMYQGSIFWQRGNGSFSGARNDILGSLRVGDNTVNTATDINPATVTYGVSGGVFSVGSGSSDNLDVGVRTNNVASTTQGRLDLTGSNMLLANVARVRVGVETGGNANGDVYGTLLLGTNATIVASAEVLVSDSNAVGIVTQSVVQTGSGNTLIQTPLMTIGGRKGFATMTVGAGGTLTLDAGTPNTMDLRLGRNDIDTSTWSRGVLDTSAGTLIASLDELIMGDKGAVGTTTNGVATGVLLTGNSASNLVTVNSVVLGRLGSSLIRTPLGETSGTLVWGGGSLTVNNDVTLGLDLGGNVGGYVSGLFTINGGTVTVGGNITTQLASAFSRGQVNLNGGTLDMTGGDITVNSFSHRGGTLANLGLLTVNSNHDAFVFGDVNVNYAVNVTSAGSVNFRYEGTPAGTGATISTALDLGTYYRDFVVGDSAAAASDLVVSGVISGSGGFSKLGAGNMALTNANTYAGRTQVLHGTLTVGDGGTNGTLGSSTSAIVVNGTLAFRRSDSVALANQIIGLGNLRQDGPAGSLLVLTGLNTYSGTTFVGSGTTLQVGDGGASGTVGLGVITNQGSLVYNRSDNFVVSNVITGSGTLTKLGAGVMTLEVPSGYLGTTTISQGTLVLGRGQRFLNGTNVLAASMMDSSASVNVAAGAFFNVTEARNRVLKLSGLSGSGTVYLGGATANAAGLIWEATNASPVVFDGTLENGAGALAGFFIKSGSGAVSFTGNNTYTGFTRVEQGTLSIDRVGGTLADAANVVLSNHSTAVLNINQSETIAAFLGGGDIFAYQGVNTFAPTPSITAPVGAYLAGGSGTINIANGQTLTSNVTTTNFSFSGVIAGEGSLTITGGNHNVGLFGANTFTGGLNIGTGTPVSGTVYLGLAGRATGVGAVATADVRGSLADSLVVNLANQASTGFNLNNVSETIGSIVGGGGTGGTVSLGTGLAVLTLSNASGTYSNAISGNGAVVKQGAGVYQLAGANTFTGSLTISGGVLESNNTSALADTLRVIVETGAEYRMLQNDTIGSLEGAGTVNLNAGTARTLAVSTPNGKVFSGNIVGTGGVFTIGAANTWGGALTLSGANTYTGNTNITDATLILDQNGVGGSNILGATNLVLSGATIVMRGSAGTEAVGNTTLNAGATAVHRWNTPPFEADTARLALGSITRNAGSALYVSNTAATTSQANASGINILGGYAVYEGGTWAVANGASNPVSGLLESSYTANIFGTNVHTNIVSSTSTALLTTGTGTLRFATNTGGDIVLTLGDNLAISSGGILVTSAVGSDLVKITKGSGSFNLSSGVTDLIVHQLNPYGTLEIDANITGGTGGHFTKSGPGRVVLTAANTYTGTTYLLGGILQIGNGVTGSIAAGSAIDNRGTLVMNLASVATQTGIISGYGNVEKLGASVLNWNATNTYTGRTRILEGTLQTTNSAGMGASGLNNLTVVASGATLSYLLGANANIDENIVLQGGKLSFGGGVTGTFRTLVTLQGDSVLEVAAGSTMTLSTAPLIGSVKTDGTLSDLTVQGGGTLILQGASNFGDIAVTGNSTLNILGNSTTGNIGGTGILNNGSAGNISVASGSSLIVRRQFDGMFHHQLSGAGTVTFLSNTTTLTQNSALTGAVFIGNSGIQNAAVNVGTEGFSGDLGTGDITVSSINNGTSSLRYLRMDNLVLTNNFFLNPHNSGAIPVNAVLSKNGLNVVEMSGTITAGAGTTDGSTARLTTGGGLLRLTGNLVNSTSNALRIDNGGTLEFSGSLDRTLASNSYISGSGLILFNGSGITTLQGNNTNNGNMVVNRGTLVFDRNGGSATDSSTLYVNNGATVQFNFTDSIGVVGSNRSANVVLNNATILTLNGPGNVGSFLFGRVTQAGTGNAGIIKTNVNTTVGLYHNDNSFMGTVEVRQGALEVTSIGAVGANSAIGGGSTIVLGSGADTGTLRYIGSGTTTSRAFQLAGAAGGGTIEASGTGALIFNSATTVSTTAATTKTFTLGGNTGVLATLGNYPQMVNVFGGLISDGTATLNLAKSGTSVWEINRANTYTGTTTIGGGGGLRVTANDALGTAAGITTLNNATLDLVNVNYSTAESLTMANGAAVLRTSSGSSTFAGAITLTAAGAMQVDTSATLQLNGVVSGNFALTKNGNGLLAFNNNLTSLNSGLTINSGTVRIAAGGTDRLNDALLLTLTNTSGAGATLELRNASETIGRLVGQAGTTVTLDGTVLTLGASVVASDTSTVSATFNGVIRNGTSVGSVVKSGTTRQDFNGLNTYTGSTTINTGATLRIWQLANNGTASGIGRGGITPAAADLVINGGILEFLALDANTIANTGFTAFSSNREFMVGTLGATINNNSGSALATYSFTSVTGSVAVAGSGARTLTLGGSNTGGTTALSAGLGSDNVFSLVIGNGAVPASDVVSVTKNGAGTWVLNNTNTYTGATNITDGILVVTKDGALGTTASGTTINGTNAILEFRNVTYTTAEAITVTNGGFRATGGGSSFAGNITLSSNNHVVNVLGINDSLTLDGVVSGGGASGNPLLVKRGLGTLVLTNQNTLSNATTTSDTIRVEGGTLALDYSTGLTSRIADTAIVRLGGNRSPGATLELRGGAAAYTEVISNFQMFEGAHRVIRTSGSSTINFNGITRSAGATLDVQSGVATTDSTNNNGILGGWMTVNKNDWAMNSTNGADGAVVAYTGYSNDAWLINSNVNVTTSATVSGQANSLRFGTSAAITLDMGAVTLDTGGILLTSAVTNKVLLSGGTLTVNAAAQSQSNLTVIHYGTGILEISSSISNNGGTGVGLLKSGSGTLVLSGDNAFSGRSFVAAGTLEIGNGGATGTLGNNTVQTDLFTGATLRWNTTTDQNYSGALVSLATVDLDPSTPGGGLIVKDNSNALTFSGDNSAYGGVIRVNAGRLVINHNNALGAAGSLYTNTGYTQVNSGGTLEILHTRTSAESIVMSGGRLLLSTGATAGAATFSGHLNFSGGSSTVEAQANTILTLSGQLLGSGGFTKTGGGVLVLSGSNLDVNTLGTPLTGQIIATAGILRLSTGARNLGAVGAGNETVIQAGATLDLNDQDLNIENDTTASREIIRISGTGASANLGALTNLGAGTAQLSHLELGGDATIGGTYAGVADGRFDGRAIMLSAYDTDPNANWRNWQKATLNGNGFDLTKIGANGLYLRSVDITNLGVLSILEGRVYLDQLRSVDTNVVASDEQIFAPTLLRASQIERVVVAYGGPTVDPVTNALNPIFGAKLVFNNQNNTVALPNDVPITLNNGYIEVRGDTFAHSDVATGRAPVTTRLAGQITLMGAAEKNFFNVEGGNFANFAAGPSALSGLVSEVPNKLVISGALTGDGGFAKIGSRELRLTANNTYTGATYLTRGVFARVPFIDVGQGYADYWGTTLAGNNGALSGTSKIQLERNGYLMVDNSKTLESSTGSVTTATNGNRINDSANIVMNGGFIEFRPFDTGTSSESIATTGGASLQVGRGTNFIDFDLFDQTNDVAQNFTLTIGSITRSEGAILKFRSFDNTSTFSGNSNGDSVKIVLNSLSELDMVGSGNGTGRAIARGLFGGIAPFALDTRLADILDQDRNRQQFTGGQFMTVDSGNVLRPLYSTEYATSLQANQNVNLSEFYTFARNSITLNSLRFGNLQDTNFTGTYGVDQTTLLGMQNTSMTLGIDDSVTVAISSGMIISAGMGVGNTAPNAVIQGGGILDFGNQDAILHSVGGFFRTTDGTYQGTNLEIRSRIAGTGGLTKTGFQNVILESANLYSGNTYVSEGSLLAAHTGALGQSTRVIVDGSGSFALYGGVRAGDGMKVTSRILSGDQNILRSFGGAGQVNTWAGDVEIDNVDSLGHVLFTPRLRADSNSTLRVLGNIYGGNTAVTNDIYFSDSRIVSTASDQTGTIYMLYGQVRDKESGAVGGTVSLQPTGAGLVNENDVLRFHVGGGDDNNVVMFQQYNAAGRLILDRGYLRIAYDPTAVANDGTGFWTDTALSRIPNGNGHAVLQSAGDPTSGMTGFVMGVNLANAGGTSRISLLLTQDQQRFNMNQWRVSNQNSGTILIGGENTTGTVFYGDGSALSNIELNSRGVNLYAAAGGTVNFQTRFNRVAGNGGYTKVGRGTVILSGSAAGASTADRLAVRSGKLVFDYGTGSILLNNNRVNSDTQLTLGGGTLHLLGNDQAATAQSMTGTITINRGNSEVAVESRSGTGAFNTSLAIGGSGTGLTRNAGGTVNFVEIDPLGGGSATLSFQTNTAGFMDSFLGWATYGNALGQVNDFAYFNSATAVRVIQFARPAGQEKNNVATWSAADNVSEQNIAGSTGFTGTLGASLSVNSIHFDVAADSAINLGGNNLTVSSGGILVSTQVGGANKTISGAGSLTGSSSELILHHYGTGVLEIASTISGANNLVVSGARATSADRAESNAAGVVRLSGANNFTGKTFLNGAILEVDNVTARLGIDPGAVVADQLYFNGGALRFTGSTSNNVINANRGIQLGSNGGVLEVADPNGVLVLRSVIAGENAGSQGDGDLIIRANGAVQFGVATSAADTQDLTGVSNTYTGLTVVESGTVIVEGTPNDGATISPFGSNESYIDATVFRQGTSLIIRPHVGDASRDGEVKLDEWFVFEGNNVLTTGGIDSNGVNSNRQIRLNGVLDVRGTLTINAISELVTNFDGANGFITGTGTIIKQGIGTWQIRESSPDWKGQLIINEGRVLAGSQGSPLGTGTLPILLGNDSMPAGGSPQLLLHPENGWGYYEINHDIVVRYSPLQEKRIGGVSISDSVLYADLSFNGNIQLNDNVTFILDDGTTAPGGNYVHMNFNGDISDGATTSGNILFRVAASDSSNGEMWTYFYLNGNNSAWTGDAIISANTSYDDDQNAIVRLGSASALNVANDVIMNFNSRLQIGGYNTTIGSLWTQGGAGALSTELIENGSNTTASLTITQTTPSTYEAQWDALFMDGNLPSHLLRPEESTAGTGRLNVVKAGDGWATMTLNNGYTGTTTVAAGILQVGRNGIGDTGADSNAGGIVVQTGGTLAGTGTVQGRGAGFTQHLISGQLKPGDLAGDSTGTLTFNGNTRLEGATVSLQIYRSSFTDYGLTPYDLNSDGLSDATYNSRVLGLSSTYAGLLAEPITLNAHDHVEINGELSVVNTKFAIVNTGYSAQLGDVFNLMDWVGTLTGSINVGDRFRVGGETGTDLDLPTLGGGYRWDTSLFASQGILIVTAVPEPSRALLLLLGLMAFVLRRRRNK